MLRIFRQISRPLYTQSVLQTQNIKEPELNIIKVPKPIRSPSEPLDLKRKRLLYCSRKRGILETDLLLSTFSQKYLSEMDAKMLNEYDELLEENDWDIYYWCINKTLPPSQISDMIIFPLLVEHSKNVDKRLLKMPDLD